MENKKIIRAKELFYQNKLQKSKQLFTDLYKKNYDEPLINFFLGRIYNKNNQKITALFHFFLALKKNKKGNQFYHFVFNFLSGICVANHYRNFLREVCIFFFRDDFVNHSLCFTNALKLSKFESDREIIEKNIFEIHSIKIKDYKSIFLDELFCLILKKTIIRDKTLEFFLVRVRNDFLKIAIEDETKKLKKYFFFLICLAEQCYLNEFIFYESKEERKRISSLIKKIESKDILDENEILILSMYRPVNSIKSIKQKLLNYEHNNISFEEFIIFTIKMNSQEAEIMKSIKSFPLIKNTTSKKVKEQYEENPYPRWRNYYCNSKVNIYEKLSRDYYDQNIKNINVKEPNILIAGCGTGFQVFLTSEIENARILAIDLSKRSLSYSIRKTNEARIKNVTYLNMDLLDLNMINKSFDIIECVGVLHHMKEPLKGLKSLLNSLKTNGLLRLGIYSKIARKSVTYCRNFFAEKKVVSDLEKIRKCRLKIFRFNDNVYFNQLTKSIDFYSTSRVRDLLFHVQEHNFNLIEVEKILRDHNLRFVGFANLSFEVYHRFIKIYKEGSLKDLRKWHDFEEKNPSLFLSMYNIWVQKLN